MFYEGGNKMNSETILTSVVVSAFITTTFNLIESIMDNKSRRSDAIRVFRYTKLYEIMVDLQKKNKEITGNNSLAIELARNQNLTKSFSLARPLINEDLWGNINEIFNEITNIKIRIIESSSEQEKLNEYTKHLIKINGQAEEYIETTIQKQMAMLLNTYNM